MSSLRPPVPWDIPPFPKKGNVSQYILFAAIGRTLNAWEEVEIALAHLYSVLLTGDRFDTAAMHAYGAPANFNQRLLQLQQAGERYFVQHPLQQVEGEFSRLTTFISGYSARRNDIAHAHALYIHWIVPPTQSVVMFSADERQWCLVPPHFRANKFTTQNRPTYVLTSREINEFGLVFWDLVRAISNLSIWMLRHDPPLPYTRPRPGALPHKVRGPRIR